MTRNIDQGRRKVLLSLVAVPVGVTLFPRRARAEHYQAMLCGDCGFGSKKDNCAKCGKWIGSSKQIAYVGDCCGFGSKKENCVVCGKWAA